MFVVVLKNLEEAHFTRVCFANNLGQGLIIILKLTLQVRKFEVKFISEKITGAQE